MVAPLRLRALLLAATFGLSPMACATDRKNEPVSQPLSASADPERARVAAMLGGPEGAVSPEQWKALGPTALTPLRQLAADPAELPERRARAASAMAYVENPEASAALQSFASDGNALPSVRRNAILALVVREGPAAAPMLAPLLGDREADIRSTTARALGNAGGPEARAALQARLDAESDPRVRDEIQKSLARTTN